LAAADHQKEIFFPPCSNKDTLAYDCLPKTVNQALGCLFFTKREQLIRLLKLHYKKCSKAAIMMKGKQGGVSIKVLRDFAISDNLIYSFKHMVTFKRA
jgi:hypothetical protein